MRFKWLMLSAVLASCQAAPEEEPAAATARVHCTKVEQHTFNTSLALRGTVMAEPDHDALVSAEVPGRLLRVLVREGDVVKRHAVLAQVEARPFEDAMRQAEAQVAQADAARTAASALATREQHLFERGISARQAVETAAAGLAHAEASHASARAQVDMARQHLDHTLVRSPIEGVVVHLFRRTGEVVDGASTTPILEVADPTALELAASAQARDLVQLQLGQLATLHFEALPNLTFSARVRAISPSVDPATGVGSVRLTIESTKVRPPLGLLGQAQIATGLSRTLVAVPASAIRNAGGAASEVVLCEAGRAVPRSVEVGERRDGLVEVEHGLSVGQRIATDELVGLEQGMAIEERP